MSTPPTELEKVQKEIEDINALQEKDFKDWTVVEKRKYGKNEDDAYDAYEQLREEKKQLREEKKQLRKKELLLLRQLPQQQQASKNNMTG